MASKAEKIAEQKKSNVIERIREFLLEVEQERKKIVWPTRDTLVNSTITVTLLIVLLSIYMAVGEVAVRQLFKLIGAGV